MFVRKKGKYRIRAQSYYTSAIKSKQRKLSSFFSLNDLWSPTSMKEIYYISLLSSNRL
jgi:hypothetical protein